MDRILSFSMLLTVMALALVLFFPTGALSQNSSCDQSSLIGLAPCLPYVEAGNTTNPGSDCCTPLGSLLSTQPSCLCQLGPLAQASGTTINATRALEVAAVCNLSVTTSVSSCLLASIPAAAPSGSTLTPPATSGSSSGDNGNAGITVSPSSFVGGVVILMISTLLSL